MDYILSKVQIAESVHAVTVKVSGFKTARISFSFACNLSGQNSENALVSQLVLRSSEELSDFTLLSRRLAELYGASLSSDVMKIGEQQVVKISLSCIEDRFALGGESVAVECLELLLNLIFKPNIKNGAFDFKETESEKRLLAEQIESEKNEKGIYAKLRLEQIMFKDELYALNRFGDTEAIQAITPESAAKNYYEYLKRAAVRINLIGEMDFDRAVSLIKERFLSLDRTPDPLETVFIPSADTVRYESETDEVNQGKLVMGFRAGMENYDDNHYAARVMTDLFGGGTYSKLFKVVREKMSLCYYCSASLVAQKGVIIVQSGIETENEEKAKNAILAQLEDVKAGNFTDEDLKSSIDSLCDRFGSASDSPDELDYLFSQQLVTDELKRPSEYVENFKKVTREDVVAAAKKVTLDTVFMLKSPVKEEEKTDA